MTQQSYIFVCEMHEDYGHLGWRLRGVPNFDPLTGMAVAHDILEHFPGDRGSIEDEFQALGAMWLVRGETGYDTRGTEAAYRNLASDYGELFRHSLNRGALIVTSEPRCAEEVETAFLRAQQLARRELLRHEFPERKYRSDVRSFVRDSVPWMRRGYRRAQERYSGLSTMRILDMFRKIEKQADALLKDEAVEGREMEVKVDLPTYKVSVELVELEYDYGMEDEDGND